MDPITQNFSLESQKEMSHIEQVGEAFQKRCDQLRLETEQKIAALDQKDPDLHNKENHLKLDLKNALDKMIDEFEKELKGSFRQSIVILEGIYHQKELMRLKEIEQEILSYK